MEWRSMTEEHVQRKITDEDRRNFLKILGVGGIIAGSSFTLEEVGSAVEAGETAELAAMGQAIRNDLTGKLDAALLNTEIANTASQIERIPELHAAGIPAEQGTEYQELAAPAWAIHDHLKSVGFFESVETHLPAFTAAHIESAARELVRTDTVITALSELGFDDQEQVALVTGAATNSDRLAEWVPTNLLADAAAEGFNVDHVAPLQERAVAGSLLWVDDLDRHLWQSEVLISDEMFDAGLWDTRTMLAGVHLVATVAGDIAEEASVLSDSQLTAALTGGTALAITGQEDVAADLYRVSDEMRAPRGGN